MTTPTIDLSGDPIEAVKGIRRVLIDRAMLLEALELIRDGDYGWAGCREIAREAIAQVSQP